MIDDSEQACVTWKKVRSIVLQMHQLWATGVDSKQWGGGNFLIFILQGWVLKCLHMVYEKLDCYLKQMKKDEVNVILWKIKRRLCSMSYKCSKFTCC